MRATELIVKLQQVIAANGDMEIFLREDGCGGEALYTSFCDVAVKTITPHDLLSDYEMNHDSISELFPGIELPVKTEDDDEGLYEWIDNNYDGDAKCKYITIVGEHLIYSS